MIVNTDADNQYYGPHVARLVRPILQGRADMVIGDREVTGIEHFSALKKLLQRLGSWVVRQASSTSVPDTTSGFRAYNREAAIQMLVVSKFTYTLETIIQAGKLLVAIDHVPVSTNPKTRESRLFPSMGAYVRRNAVSIFRIYAQYEPLRVFWSLALLIGLAAVGVWIRFAVAYAEGNGKGHVQSLILGAVLFIAAVVLWALGVIGDLLAAQRVMTQKTYERVRRIELQLGVAPSHYEPGAQRAGRGERSPTTTRSRAPSGVRRRFVGASDRRPKSTRRRACERGDRLRRRCRNRQHLRQVRLGQPDRPPPDVRLRARPGRSPASSPTRPRCSTSAAARAFSCTAGPSAWQGRRVVGIDLEEESIQAGWSAHSAPNLEYRTMAAENLPFADRRVRHGKRDRAARARARPSRTRSTRWRAAPSAICWSRCRASRCGAR